MARVGYCRHDIPYGGEDREIEVDGKIIKLPKHKCHYCEAEDKAQRDAEERRQEANLNLVKSNLLRLLKEDEAFRREVMGLLLKDSQNTQEIGRAAKRYKGW